VALTLMVALGVLCGARPVAADTAVEGAADFRTAPVIGDGEYADSITVGGQLWYGVMATVGVPLTLTGGLTEGGDRKDLTFAMHLRGDSLETMGNSSPNKLEVVFRQLSAAKTEVVFFQVDLVGTEKQGDELDFRFTIAGARSPSTEPCEEDSCTAGKEAAEAEAKLAGLKGDTTASTVVTVEKQASDLQAANTQLAGQVDAEAGGINGWVAVGLAGCGALLLGAAALLRRNRRSQVVG